MGKLQKVVDLSLLIGAIFISVLIVLLIVYDSWVVVGIVAKYLASIWFFGVFIAFLLVIVRKLR